MSLTLVQLKQKDSWRPVCKLLLSETRNKICQDRAFLGTRTERASHVGGWALARRRRPG